MIKVKVNFKKKDIVKVRTQGVWTEIITELCAICHSVIMGLSKGDKEMAQIVLEGVSKTVANMIEEEDKYVQRVRTL